MHCSDSWFQRQVLDWYDQHGRRDLPWQKSKTAYRVWVSEIMLQQTQVTTVIPYFERFMRAFPTVINLAEASHDDVMHLWTGLGYYARARNLHQTAKHIVAEFNGDFPSDPNLLVTLPGIGRSTAAAIASSAFNVPAAILDGNVKRVLARFFALDEWPGSTQAQNQLWQWSEQLTPTARVADYNQVMMDLGSLICTRTKPKCETCPIAEQCLALSSHQTSQLPVAKPKKEKPVKQAYFLIRQLSDGRVELKKRPSNSIWGGLYCFPWFESLEGLCESIGLGALPSGTQHWNTFRHTFSHYHLEITPILTPLPHDTDTKSASDSLWYNPLIIEDEQRIGLPSPMVDLLEKLTQQF